MLNVTVLIGRLTADPELRYTVSGTAVSNFRLAVDRPFTNREGERETDFLDIVCWRKLAETVAANLNKGRLVAVKGRIQARNWETADGERRRTVEIVADEVRFLDWPKDRSGSSKAKSQKGQEIDDFEDLFEEDFEDEVPF
ncbi:MAG: single-stranded DNA-binding protein [Bacillota bacterium]